jgi:adenylate cyclase
MGADEAGTLATLRRRRAAMATLIERHEGRVVNSLLEIARRRLPE